MKKTLFSSILLLCFCISCTHHFGVKDPMLRHLPKEVPEMVMRHYAGNDIRTPDTIYGESFHCILSFFLVSKHEITNKQFCYFLNADSIRTNTAEVNSIIDLSNADSKIHVQDGNYVPVKGYENYPVVLVSWWGVKKYCRWLTDYVDEQWKGKRSSVLYRLPTEFEWLIASSSNASYDFTVEKVCDSMDMHVYDTGSRSYNVKSDTLNAGGVAGMNENVFEWTADDFYTVQHAMISDILTYHYYNDEIAANVLVRKHGYINSSCCGRLSRSRTGFYSDTGFRIVQTYLGKSSGVEF